MGFLPGGGILLSVQVMKRPMRTAICVLAGALLAAGFPFRSEAKSYCSGSGHSYSSHSSSSSGSHSFSSGGSHSSNSGISHSFSSGSGHTFNSGSSHSGSGESTHNSSSGNSSGSHSANWAGSAGSGSSGGKTFNSGSGKSYSAGSTWSDSGRHSYTSSKSYSSGAGHTFASTPDSDSGVREARSARGASPDSGGSGFTYDNAAAHARKEEASKSKFTQFRESQLPSPATPSEGSRSPAPSYRVQPPPIRVTAGDSYRRVVYVPDARVLSSRPVRIYNVFNCYSSRPWVTYQDPYNSLFWWWLLDRSIDDRAWWAYHHRYDMDPARYQALVASDQQLESRVEQLENQQAPRDPNYTPPGVERDLMYSDRYVQQAYSNRPTTSGVFAFWLLAVPTALGVSGLFIWLIWFKRWQTAAPVAP